MGLKAKGLPLTCLPKLQMYFCNVPAYLSFIDINNPQFYKM